MGIREKKKIVSAVRFMLLILLFVGVSFASMFHLHKLVHNNKQILSCEEFNVMVIMLALFAFLFIVECLNFYHRSIYVDNMTNIGNSDWIVKKGAILFCRKKLFDYYAIFLNIQDCKYFNKKFGNKNGDKILNSYAQNVKNYLKGRGLIGRMGGDNFFAFVKKDELEGFLDYVKNVYVDVNYEEKNIQLMVKTRCGISQVVEGVPYRANINNAAEALAVAKEKGERVVFYESAITEKMVEEKEILADFKRGLAKRELMPYYQPKIDTSNNTMCGAEALVRWVKEGKVLFPSYFVPILEKIGNVVDLDFYIFEYVCQDIRGWIDKGFDVVKISTNFSKENLREQDFAQKIIDIKNKYHIDGKYLEVEITETTDTEEMQGLIDFLNKMHEVGITVAIDDFGTGYSSLAMLREFQADVIKLDKSIIDTVISDDKKSILFLQDIIKLIKHQGRHIVCEGVEEKQQIEFLQNAECDIIQGFIYDEALSYADFGKRLIDKKYINE